MGLGDKRLTKMTGNGKRRDREALPAAPGRRAAVCLLLFLAAFLLEVSVCQASFWSTFFAEGTDVSGQLEVLWEYVAAEDMEKAQAREESGAYADEQGFMHASEGAALLRLTGLDREVSRIHLDLTIPDGYLVRATVFAQDEGDCYTYQLGEGRTLLQSVPEQAWMKIYPYGRVDNLYIRLETADIKGEAAAGAMGELIVKINGMELDMRMPFTFRALRMLLIFALLLLMYCLGERSGLVKIPFMPADGKQKRRRLAAVIVYTGVLLVLAAFFVRSNPSCRKNLALHHAQYQELARALAVGEVSVGRADPALLEVENPYDTINLQAKQIPYQADYAYRDGSYYVYFGIVPELLTYLPYYLATGKDLPNYCAVFLFYAGFIVSSSGLIYELMKRFFRDSPFYLYGIGVFMLTAGYSYFYLLLRPDLYHVPIAASCMFTAAGLWFYLKGLNGARHSLAFYALGSLCLALTAGCRPQFVLFAMLAVPLFWKEIFGKGQRAPAAIGTAEDEGKRKRRRPAMTPRAAALLTLLAPYLIVAAGLMYYNALRFGSPFDFGAAYSLTSNDMTHRGFNLERVLYGMWYFLFQPVHLEADFPFLRSAAIETDYLGRMMSESIFGGVFACSLLTLPVFFLHRLGRMADRREGVWTAALCAAVSLTICAVDATGAGILQRYSGDISFGIFLAAVFGLFGLERWAEKKKVTGVFLIWLRAALCLHLAFLFLIFIQAEGSINLLTGNPSLYYEIQAMLRF